jgi:2'-5' RNA ligase
MEPFELELKTVGVFPKWDKPRVVTIDHFQKFHNLRSEKVKNKKKEDREKNEERRRRRRRRKRQCFLIVEIVTGLELKVCLF